MSLVHEALRKAAREKQRKLGNAPLSPSAPPPRPVVPQSVHAPVAQTHPAPARVPSAAHAAPQATPSATGAAPIAEGSNRFLLPALIGCVAIVAIIAIVFLASNAFNMWHQSKDTTPITSAAVAVVPAKPEVAAEPAPVVHPTTSTTPVTPPPAAVATPPSSPAPPVLDDGRYKISGIMKNPDGSYSAIINSRVAYEGYYIDGATIDKIESDRVTIDIKGQKAVLRLF